MKDATKIGARLALWSLAALSGCGYEVTAGRAMGTAYTVQAGCPSGIPVGEVLGVLDRVNQRMSTYDPDSELMLFNRAPVGTWLDVSPELGDVVAAAKEVAEHTGGAFDPTVGPLVALWGFGAFASTAVPEPAQVRAAKALVDYRNLRHRPSPPALAKQHPLSLDLSGIAKGHAVDGMAAALESAGCENYLIEFGGEIRVRGRSPKGGPWRIGIDSPNEEGNLGDALLLDEAAVATSGDYRQYRERDGRRLSHIIDPRTGYPVDHRLASVTVVADSARAADAYATALMVLGERDGLQFAEDARLAAVFVIRDGDGFETVRSASMAALR